MNVNFWCAPMRVAGLHIIEMLYVPLTIYGYMRLLQSGQASIATAFLAFAIGASYQLWATAIHRWRTRGAKAE